MDADAGAVYSKVVGGGVAARDGTGVLFKARTNANKAGLLNRRRLACADARFNQYELIILSSDEFSCCGFRQCALVLPTFAEYTIVTLTGSPRPDWIVGMRH